VAEDVSDLVAIATPHETPLLDALGDPARSARSTVHEWLEDTLLPRTDVINDSTYANSLTDTTFVVQNADRFRPGDQIQTSEFGEVMLVTAVNTGTNTLTVVRGYGGSNPTALANGLAVNILGNAALEGDAADAARFTARSRKTNYTQIFSSTVEVSGSELAVRQLAVADELDYQYSKRQPPTFARLRPRRLRASVRDPFVPLLLLVLRWLLWDLLKIVLAKLRW
jgi:hypothetical protein